MKTLVFVGSPKRKGNTMALVNELVSNLDGEVEVVNVFDHLDKKPCIDCGYCVKNHGCAIKDGYDEIIKKIEEADAFVVAAPMWFGNIAGPMMSFFSRLQTISCGLIFRKDIVHKWDKAGVFIMTTGAKWHSMAKSVETTAEFIFNHLDALIMDFIYANSTDILSADKNEQAIMKCRKAAQTLNSWYKDKSEGKYYKYGYSSENYIRVEKNTISN